MEYHRFLDYFVVTGLPPPSEWQADRSDAVNHQDPVVDIVVINRTLGEESPPDYKCIEFTRTGLSANLNHGSLRAPEMFLCYRCGRDRQPIVEIRFDYFVLWLSIFTIVMSFVSIGHKRSVCLDSRRCAKVVNSKHYVNKIPFQYLWWYAAAILRGAV